MITALAENATRFVAGNATSSGIANATATVMGSANGTVSGVANDSAAVGAEAAAASAPPVAFSWFGYFEAIAVMFLLLAALWGLLWLARRYGKFRFLPAPGNFPQNALRIEAQLPLGPRRGLYVIRYLDERLLIGVTENQISLLQESSLGELSHDEQSNFGDMCASHPDAQRFARLMEQEQTAIQKPVSPADRHDK